MKMPALCLPNRLSSPGYVLLMTLVVVLNFSCTLVTAQSPVLTVWATPAECPNSTSVFFDEKQNVILATCRDYGIIAIQLPQRIITTLISVDICWWPQMLNGDASEGIAFAACYNPGEPPGDPSQTASSVMLSGPAYTNVSMFTSYIDCGWVGGFAWDRAAPVKDSSSQPLVYMTCAVDSGSTAPTIIAKSSGSNHTIIPLVNSSVNCEFSSIVFSGGLLYTSCGTQDLDQNYWLVSFDVQTLELKVLFQGNSTGEPFVAMALAVTPTCDHQAVKLVYGMEVLSYAFVQNGRLVNVTNLTNATQCGLPLSISFHANSSDCDTSNEVFVACSEYGDSVVSVDLLQPSSPKVVIPFSDCANPFGTYWHAPSACLFAACLSGPVISLCDFTRLND